MVAEEDDLVTVDLELSDKCLAILTEMAKERGIPIDALVIDILTQQLNREKSKCVTEED
jgi:hypothetical protein